MLAITPSLPAPPPGGTHRPTPDTDIPHLSDAWSMSAFVMPRHAALNPRGTHSSRARWCLLRVDHPKQTICEWSVFVHVPYCSQSTLVLALTCVCRT